MTNDTANHCIRAAILGHAVGDALGVPVEFKSRDQLDANPVRDMRGYGAHHQPAGTWSDDTSLTLCLAESLIGGFNLQDQARKFVAWLYEGYWTPRGEVFDAGVTTLNAIGRLRGGVEPILAGGTHVHTNGNGSLMRVLPLGLYFANAPRPKRIAAAMTCSMLTHAHPRSQCVCALFVEVATGLVRGVPMLDALAESQDHVGKAIEREYPAERLAFTRTLDRALANYPRYEIFGSGYVIQSLDAALWCCLNTEIYTDAVLTAVNLGQDTDTTAAIAGGLAGLMYGESAMPSGWREQLARLDDIYNLCDRFADACAASWLRADNEMELT